MYYFFIFLILTPLIIFEVSERLALQTIKNFLPGYESFILRKKISFFFSDHVGTKYSWFYHVDWSILIDHLKNEGDKHRILGRIKALHLARKMGSLSMYIVPIGIIAYQKLK